MGGRRLRAGRSVGAAALSKVGPSAAALAAQFRDSTLDEIHGAEARGEIAYAAEFLRHFAGEATRISGGYQTAPAGGARFLIAKQPVGPCLLITPWNFPMAMGTRKLGPAIAAGCTSVVKPAHQTPLSMLALAELGLIDQYEFVVHPRLAGHGPTLFAGLSKPIDLKLVSRLEFGSGAVAMRYEPRR